MSILFWKITTTSLALLSGLLLFFLFWIRQSYQDKGSLSSHIKRNLLTDLHKALEKEQFVLYYQPQVHLKERKMLGCEALIRWAHPQKGIISPFFFMKAVESTDLITSIGEWTLQKACEQSVMWQRQGRAPIRMSVNISARQLFQTDFVKKVETILRETTLSPHLLELELTESAFVQNVKQAIEVMQALKALGVGLALDDFGTGYSSLSHLMQFPVNELKIDGSFVKVIETEQKGYTLVKGIIELGHSLNLQVVAEGVETKAQLRYLMQHKCEVAQGYYFSPPQSHDKFIDFFETEWPI